MKYFLVPVMLLLTSCQSSQTEDWTVITVVESSETDQPELSEETKKYLAAMEERERNAIDARLGSTTSRCSIHDALLSEDIVPLVFGFPVGHDEYDKTSAPSTLNSRIHRFQFATCVVDSHLPVDAALGGVGVG